MQHIHFRMHPVRIGRTDSGYSEGIRAILVRSGSRMTMQE